MVPLGAAGEVPESARRRPVENPLPPAIADELRALRVTLDAALPPKRVDHNLLVATWNLRAFGGLTESWAAGADDSPKRDLHALACIAEISPGST